MTNKTASRHIAGSFLAGAKARSLENRKSFGLLYDQGCHGVCIGLMRQELDTLLRLSFLWRPETAADVAVSLMEKTVTKGSRWSFKENGKKVMLSDKSMVAFAHFLGGWERVAYEFGCKAIHLSDLHAYLVGDPMKNLSQHDRQEIAHYLSSYHGYDGKDLTMDDMVSYLPKVMEKISSNVESYLEELEERYVHAG
ncbi:MAG: hypothetical protein EON56_04530 [Alphaproteobacteria bacterium]|nr:MAG: hypothetical protein EON56_04530 [Alphaproteobacteria bacterium]